MTNGRCRLHGGLSLKGVNAPSFKHGRRSKYLKNLPRQLRNGYRELLADPDLLSLKEEIGLLTARINEVLGRLSESAPPPWDAILESLVKVESAVGKGNATKTLPAVRAMAELVRSGKEATVNQRQCWSELREIIQEKTKTASAEWNRLNELNGVVTVEQALLFARAFLSAARECVTDRTMLRALQERTLTLLPPAESNGVAYAPRSEDGAPPEQLPRGLKELPPGADPDDYEWVPDEDNNDALETEKEEEGDAPDADPGD
jgi:hypothetical protein